MISVIRCTVLSALTLLLPSLALPQPGGQVGQVAGYVVDTNNKAVSGAVVAFDRMIDGVLHTETRSDKSGYFALYTVPTGIYELTIKVEGQIRYRDSYFTVLSGRQSEASGRIASDPTYKLKSAEAVAAEIKQEAAQDMSPGQAAKVAKASEDLQKKKAALTQNFTAGQAALASGDYDAAIENLTRASAADPKQAVVWSRLAVAYLGAGRKTPADAAADYQKAIGAFNKAVEAAPADAANYNDWALALAESNKVNEAKDALAKAGQVDPAGSAKGYYNVGVVLSNAGKNDEAAALFKRSFEANPNYAESYYRYAVVLLGQATLDKSGKLVAPNGVAEALQKYLQLTPNGPNAQAARDILATLGK